MLVFCLKDNSNLTMWTLLLWKLARQGYVFSCLMGISIYLTTLNPIRNITTSLMFIYMFQIQGKIQRTNAEIIKNSHSLF